MSDVSVVGRWSSTARSARARLTSFRVIVAIVASTVATSTVVGPLACGAAPGRSETSAALQRP